MATFGQTLRRTREARGISLDEIANETRLSKRYILALEDEAIGKLPGGTYNRAYLRTYATCLGLDPEQLLRDYMAEEARHQQATEADQLAAMNRAIEKRGVTIGGDGAPGDRRATIRMVGLAAAAVIAVAAVGGGAWYAVAGLQRGAATLEVDRGEAVEPPTPERLATVSPASVDREAARGGERRPPVPEAAPPATTATPEASRPEAPATASAAPVAPETIPADAAVAANEPAPAAPAVAPPSTPLADPSAPRTAAVTPDSVAADAASRLTVPDSGVGTGVVDRQLVGQSDRFAAGSRVVFWTHVRGGRAGDTIDHVWFRDGVIVGAASLSVGSPDWRTQSRRLIDPSGDWVVEARDAEGHVLARHQFRADAAAGQ